MPVSTTLIAIVYHSRFGHTEAQARSIARGASHFGVQTELIPVADVDQKWDVLEAAHAIVFGTPTFFGSASPEFKTFMEKTAGIWSREGWKNKIAAGFTNSGTPAGDKLSTLMQLVVFAAQHGMHWVNLGLMPSHSASSSTFDGPNRLGVWLGATAFSFSDRDAETAPPEGDHATAEHLGRRVAEVASQLAS